MFFTQEDYRKIQDWLSRNSSKDSELLEATPLNGNEIISIVQANHNKKISIKDFVNQIFKVGSPDFFNVTDKLEAPYITLEEAISMLPTKAKKQGQVITFLNKNGNWDVYQFIGANNQCNIPDKWNNIFDIDKYIIDSLLPDEEDLTKTEPDEKGNSFLSFKDRLYDASTFSGLGKKVLRKHIIDIEVPEIGTVKKNILYQDIFEDPNTVYEIRYDFDLNGKTIELPENCILDFRGGSITNGTLVLNNTLVLPFGYIENDILKCNVEGTYKEGQMFFNREDGYFLMWDGKKWISASTYFRWGPNNTIQISRNNKDWEDLSEPFSNSLYIKGYVNSTSNLPSDALLGDIYMVGTGAPYNMYVKTSEGWKNNGQYTSITAGIEQTTGQSTTNVMSQKAVTDKFTELESEVNNIQGIFFGQSSNTEEYYDCDLAKGTINVKIVAKGATYAGVWMYDKDDNVIANPTTANYRYLTDGEEVNFNFKINNDCKKIKLHAAAGAFSAKITTDGITSLQALSLAKGNAAEIGYYKINTSGQGIYEDEVNINKGAVSCVFVASSIAYISLFFLNQNNEEISKIENLYLNANSPIRKTFALDEDCVKIRIDKVTPSNFSIEIESQDTIFKRTAIQAVEQNVQKSAAKNILYIKKDGTGDYTTIQSAINAIEDASIINQYELRVCDDYVERNLLSLYRVSDGQRNTESNPIEPCAFIVTKDYVNIVGYGRRRKIAVYSPYNLSKASYQYVQVMYLQGNVIIENLDFEIRNGRYAIHQESGGSKSSIDYNATTIMRNCKATHLGNYDASAWTAICGQANGSCSGLKMIYENVEWSPAFYTHNNPNFDSPAYYKFKNCSMNPNGEGYIDTYGCGQNFEVDVEGCNFLGMDVRVNVAANNLLSDACHDIRTHIPTINGQGNTPSAVCRILYSQFVLCFKGTQLNSNIQVVGGTAKNIIFGEDFMNYGGTNDAYAFVAGTEYIKDFAFTLGNRLGDCTSENKTLIISVDGVEQIITFNGNYVGKSNAEIISEMNTQLANVVAFFGNDKDSSMVMYPYKDCYEIGQNFSNQTILAGMPLMRDLENHCGWKICPAGTKAEGMSCERINPNKIGKVAILKKNIFKSFRDVNIKASDIYVKVQSGGYWTGTDNKEDADMIRIANGYWLGL